MDTNTDNADESSDFERQKKIADLCLELSKELANLEHDGLILRKEVESTISKIKVYQILKMINSSKTNNY